MDPWETRLQLLRSNVNNYKRERFGRRHRQSGPAVDLSSNASISLLQTITMQNLQLQQAMLTQSMIQQSRGFAPMAFAGQGVMREGDTTINPRRSRSERYNIAKNTTDDSGIENKREYKVDSSKKTVVSNRKSKSLQIRAKWKKYYNLVVIALYMSRKYRMNKSRRPKPFLEIAIDELADKCMSMTQQFKDQIKDLSSEGADFLLKDGILLFSRRPSKNQTLKFTGIINGFIDLACKITFHGSPKSKDVLYKLMNGDSITRQFWWDNETCPPQDNQAKMVLLTYFIIVKVLLMKIILKPNDSMTELEEHNLRSLAIILYRIARQVGLEVPMEVENQFRKAVQVFSKSSEDVSSWNKLLFKTFAAEIKTNVAKLTIWSENEIALLEESDDQEQVTEEAIPEPVVEDLDGHDEQVPAPTSPSKKPEEEVPSSPPKKDEGIDNEPILVAPAVPVVPQAQPNTSNATTIDNPAL